MIDAIIKGIHQLGDRRTRVPLWISIGISLGVFLVLWLILGALIKYTAIFEWGWLESIADTGAWILVLVLTWILFPGVVSGVVALFLEQVARSVELRHYPALPEAPGQPMGEAVMTAVRFLGVMVLLNLLLLPFLLLGPVYPLVFYAVNGYLLGREYFEMVAVRRVALADANRLRKANGGGVFLTGVVIALMLTVPLVNLLAPVIATAAMVHLFEGWRRADPTARADRPGPDRPRPGGGTDVDRPAGHSVLDDGEPRA